LVTYQVARKPQNLQNNSLFSEAPADTEQAPAKKNIIDNNIVERNRLGKLCIELKTKLETRERALGLREREIFL
jgi:hypothetical protein